MDSTDIDGAEKEGGGLGTLVLEGLIRLAKDLLKSPNQDLKLKTAWGEIFSAGGNWPRRRRK